MFEAVHGSAPDIAGKGIANPAALIQAAALLCEHVDQPEAGARARKAVEQVIVRGEVRTPDLGGKASTAEFTDAVIEEVATRV